MNLRCPQCDNQKIFTLTGWKRHMTHTHGGYSESELAEASGSVSDQPVRERMIEFARTVPETGAELPPGEAATSEATQAAPAPTPKAAPLPEPEKRVKATPKKLRKLIATLPGQWFEQQGIALDEEDQGAIEEAVEFLENVFGFEFAVPGDKYVIRSRFWALLWPIGVFLFIFFKHKAKAILSTATGATEEKVEEPDHGIGGADGQRQDV